MRALPPAALLLAAIIPACTTQSTTSAVEALGVRAAIDSLWTGYAHASDRKDAAAFGSLFTEDATLAYSAAPTARGREAIQAFLTRRYADVDPTGLRVEPDETRVSGSIAAQGGTFEESFTESHTEKTEYGRYVLIAEQGSDRAWRIRRLVAISDSVR